MGAPTAQVQSSQTSQPASKGAGASPSTPSPLGKGAQMSSMSGQPQIGQPNSNGNTNLSPVSAFLNSEKQPNTDFVAQPDGATTGNPYPNTIGNMGSVAGGPNGQPMAKGGGGGQGGGKGASGGAVEHGGEFNPNLTIQNTNQPSSGSKGPYANY